ncbi:MAG: DNA integrity scanning diadenylate cyclase DisA [Coriobacteriales bacterium]|jgi:diadenylate cyclase|nr:DNA integrity scanning diadenylate cyclase DisA [Coriobacteriales bacterium]
MEQARAILPDNSQDLFDSAIGRVAPGTPLRQAIDMIISAQNGALICIGDVKAVLAIGNGGFRIDLPFTPQRLFELSKMDGAIVLSDDGAQIICANFHLNPDPSLITQETGMRHRSAARTSAQTESIVIAISKRRVQTTIYRNGQALTLDPDDILLSKSNQGILALQNAKNNLEKAAIRQSFIELDDLVTAVDVANVLTRYVNLIGLAAHTERFINYLGNNSGLLRNQLDEIMHGVTESFLLTVRDYATTASAKEAKKIARALLKIPRGELDVQSIMRALGFNDPVADEDRLHPRGFRVMSRISMLDEAATSRIIEEYGLLSALVSDSKEGFDRLDNAGIDNVRAIAASFRQLRSTL